MDKEKQILFCHRRKRQVEAFPVCPVCDNTLQYFTTTKAPNCTDKHVWRCINCDHYTYDKVAPLNFVLIIQDKDSDYYEEFTCASIDHALREMIHLLKMHESFIFKLFDLKRFAFLNLQGSRRTILNYLL